MTAEVIIKKIFAWMLLLLSVSLIVWGLWYSFEIFTAKQVVPEVFKAYDKSQETTANNNAKEAANLSPQQRFQEQTQEKMQQLVKEQFEKMMPPGFTPKLFNLIAWSIFMGILIFGAGKLGNLGISLLRS